MPYYKFYTINQPGHPETVQAFNTINAARIHAARNAKKKMSEYAIWGFISHSRSEFLESRKYTPFDGMTSFKMRSTNGKLVKK
jgi:hypothetical protein